MTTLPRTHWNRSGEILTDAEKYGYLLGFSHGNDVKSGYLERRGEMVYITPVDLTVGNRG